ncbi:MAG: protein-L-isoaspartate(D-aspartate) O-methyltransferase [Elusimicrobia bacterium]|nr:protein-L-isoaspartate(D-aspartate) O-methyltransferase [Elusimicrobiota bacterium]
MIWAIFLLAASAFPASAADKAAVSALPAAVSQEDPVFAERRAEMIEAIANYDPSRPFTNGRVLTAMRDIPRHLFVPKHLIERAYDDTPLSIGEGQTISQPYIVAFMTHAVEPKPEDKVLEIGTGSGYQAAVISKLVRAVYTIEILPSLARRAEQTLKRLGYKNIHVKTGDGYLGWPKAAPFDSIIVTCAPDHVPQPLVDQLKIGGRMVIPIGEEKGGFWVLQELVLLRKTPEGVRREKTLDVSFVPMTGQAQKRKPKPRP